MSQPQVQKFFFENNNTVIQLENNLNIKPIEEIIKYLNNIFCDLNLSLSKRYVIEGSMGDYIVYDNNNITLFGECS